MGDNSVQVHVRDIGLGLELCINCGPTYKHMFQVSKQILSIKKSKKLAKIQFGLKSEYDGPKSKCKVSKQYLE